MEPPPPGPRCRTSPARPTLSLKRFGWSTSLRGPEPSGTVRTAVHWCAHLPRLFYTWRGLKSGLGSIQKQHVTDTPPKSFQANWRLRFMYMKQWKHHLLNKYLLRSYYVPDAILGTKAKQTKIPPPRDFLLGEIRTLIRTWKKTQSKPHGAGKNKAEKGHEEGWGCRWRKRVVWWFGKVCFMVRQHLCRPEGGEQARLSNICRKRF